MKGKRRTFSTDKASSRLFSRSALLQAHTEDLGDSSFCGKVGPDREPRDLVAGFLDSALYLPLLATTSLERNLHHVPCRVCLGFVDLVHPPQSVLEVFQ